MKKILKGLNPLLEKQLKNLYKLIKKSRAVIIAGHINPDGDDICSQLALGEFLKSIDKKFAIAWCDDIPKSYKFLPDLSLVTNINENPLNSLDFDLFIIVDSGDLERIGEVKNLINNNQTLINLDHHKGNTNFGDINILVEKACSIGEILYYFFTINKIEITYNMAVNLYVSIVTDSGSFRYDCMHKEVHNIAAELLKKGVAPSDFNIYLSQNKSLPYIKLLTLALSRLELFEKGRIAFSYLYFDDFNNTKEDDTDGIIEYLGMLESVSVYVLIKEKIKGSYTASLRSKYNVDVAQIALHFDGGGHMRAAGCKTDRIDLFSFRDALMNKITDQL